MVNSRSLSRGEIVLTMISAITIITASVLIVLGFPYSLIEKQEMSFWLMILVPSGVILSGVIFTYSFAQYKLDGQFRTLILLLFSVNLILIAFLYLLSNTAFDSLSPFANRERNRTIVVAFGLIMGPAALFGSITGEGKTSNRQMYGSLFWALFFVPALALWFFFSPEPVFVTTPIDQGISGFTILAWAALLGSLILLLLALFKYLKAWKSERRLIDYATSLALILWLFSVTIFSSQTNPLQWMELLWYGIFTLGEALIATITITSSVIDPQLRLAELVRIRTSELEDSREESEFYLNLWGHKIGNLLQGIMLYLGMLSTGGKDSNEIKELSDIALDISRETTMINRQVAALIKIKEEKEIQLESKIIAGAIQDAIIYTNEIVGTDCFGKELDMVDNSLRVEADEFLDLIFLNIFTYLCQQTDVPSIVIQSKQELEVVHIDILSQGIGMSNDIYNSLFSKLEPSKTTLSLDLFIVKILVSRYNGNVQYIRNEELHENIFQLTFKLSSSAISDEIPASEESIELMKKR